MFTAIVATMMTTLLLFFVHITVAGCLSRAPQQHFGTAGHSPEAQDISASK
jgi:hypothetical protein